MKIPVTGYVVMMHHQDLGTFAPAFRTIDEAEEFSNAMKLGSTFMVAEAVPIVHTITSTEYVTH
jgi:hypothetical protein